jgi:hypothetical protein
VKFALRLRSAGLIAAPALAIELAAAQPRSAWAQQPAPGEFEVDEEAVDRALERALVRTEALLLPVGTIEVEPSFSYVRNEGNITPAFFLQDGQQLPAANKVRENEFQGDLTLRLGLPFDSQLEVTVPYAHNDFSTVTTVNGAVRQEVDRSGTGFGDVNVSLAKRLLLEHGWRPDLIARITWDSNTGQTDNGIVLGSGFDEITGALTAVKRQDPLVFVGTASYTHSFAEDDVEPGDELGFSIGTVLAASPDTSLRFFLSQSFTNDIKVNGTTLNGTDQVNASVFIGASAIVAPRTLLDIQAGIGLTDDAPDYSVTISVPIRFDLPLHF